MARRLLIAGLALAGLAIAVYLTFYQLGIVPTVWEPFFGDGSRRVLHSPISRLLPVPDASLGAAGYLVEIVTGLTPKTVLFFGVAVAAMALFGLLLAAVQAFWLRAGCTLCLTSAAISVAIAGMAREEVMAAVRRASL
ncbi:MAG TPA: vitamin K epoxide reductase family protein [Thermoanaerobaculia bacterium]